MILFITFTIHSTKEETLDTTEAPEIITDNTRHPAVQLPSRRRRRILWAILAVIGLTAFSFFIVFISGLDEKHKQDGEARDHYVVQRIEAASRMMHGGIEDEGNYSWGSGSPRVYVTIKLGSCSGVEAYVPIKSDRPENYGDTEPLVVILPAERKGLPSAEVSIGAPNFYMAASSSGLRHCTNGDHRFSDVPSTE